MYKWAHRRAQRGKQHNINTHTIQHTHAARARKCVYDLLEMGAFKVDAGLASVSAVHNERTLRYVQANVHTTLYIVNTSRTQEMSYCALHIILYYERIYSSTHTTSVYKETHKKYSIICNIQEYADLKQYVIKFCRLLHTHKTNNKNSIILYTTKCPPILSACLCIFFD